jgi:hypothetical protein
MAIRAAGVAIIVLVVAQSNKIVRKDETLGLSFCHVAAERGGEAPATVWML